MRYEANIGRPDEASACEFLVELVQAGEEIRAATGAEGDICHAYAVESSYEGPDGAAVEHTVVLRLEVFDSVPRNNVGQMFHAIAESLGEDCIAILAIDDSGDEPVGYGTLVGPAAEKWGSFDLEKFERFDEDVYATAVQAAELAAAEAPDTIN